MNNLALILTATGQSALLAMAPPVSSESDPLMSALNSAEGKLIAMSLAHLVNETKRNADAVASIGESLHILTSIETQQREVMERLREGSIRMTDHEKRLQVIEQHMPQLLELRKWVIMGIVAGVGMVLVALLKLVIIDVPRIPTTYLAPQQAVPQNIP